MQGFNMGRYVPPDLEGTVSFNQASGKGHALGARASKLKSQGVLIVRFECPFPIWCTTCQPEQIIGQGVRFNAEKKKVGNYYSTPIWSFKIKHTVCGGIIEIRTDPKNTEYVVLEGGRRRDTGVDKLLEGEIEIGKVGEQNDDLRNEGSFAQLEKKIEDKQVINTQQARLKELLKRSDRDWADPYTMNKKIRKDFRVGRRQRQADEKSSLALQDKFGIGLDLLAPEEDDALRAKHIDFGNHIDASSSSKPLFIEASSAPVIQPDRERGKHGKHSISSTNKDALSTTLRANTRAATDPFTNASEVWGAPLKRKNLQDMQLANLAGIVPSASGVLVEYDSDSS